MVPKNAEANVIAKMLGIWYLEKIGQKNVKMLYGKRDKEGKAIASIAWE